jgi:hypothetical protein
MNKQQQKSFVRGGLFGEGSPGEDGKGMFHLPFNAMNIG